LLHLQYLIAFDQTITKMKEKDTEAISAYLTVSYPILARVTSAYRSRSDEKKAYLAHFLSKSKVKAPNMDMISNVMLSFVGSSSAYVRENALKTLYSIGDASYVVRAFRILNGEVLHQNVKLLSDGLVVFQGDHKVLMDKLWGEFRRFMPSIQTAIVNYMRMKSGAYTQELYTLLKDDGINQEVKLAILRYFGKHPYEPMRKLLLTMLTEETAHTWEFAAVAASVIKAYPGKETMDTLHVALNSGNWYVRFNAADSLIGLGMTQEAFFKEHRIEDPYANAMIQYRWQVYEVEQEQEQEKLREIEKKKTEVVG
ncbi:MAG: hypothetical protein RR361_07375, partial [Anaerovorax sp.]